jgi:hypothetical protein
MCYQEGLPPSLKRVKQAWLGKTISHIEGKTIFTGAGNRGRNRRTPPTYFQKGRAIAQAVSRRLPTAVTRARAQVRSCGICGGQSGPWAGFIRVLMFPLQILIPPTAPLIIIIYHLGLVQ